MSSQSPKIVVITPVKNEAWILERFLSVTSQFADHIIIADQSSTDGSVAICKKFPKVILIENKSGQFNEAERQLLLIQTARELIPDRKIILALDADEILAANAPQTLGWQTMLRAEPGTVLCFEKPDLYQTPNQCIRYTTPWPLGYVDDGMEHKPKKIHSIRIPMPDYAPRLHIHDVKVLHYGYIRSSGQTAKVRFYSVVETALKTRHVLLRRSGYAANIDWTKNGVAAPSQPEWLAGWEMLGIDMRTIRCDYYYWYDFEVLKHFSQFGVRRFWLEDIWNFDWESCRQYAKSKNISPIPEHPISPPPKILGQLMDWLIYFYTRFRKVFKGV